MIRTLVAAIALLCTIASANACIPSADVMRPCAFQPNFLAGVRSIHIRMHRVKASDNQPLPAVAGNLRVLVDSAASAAGVPAGIAHAVIRQESNYDPAMRGRAGEWGLGQIKCTTAREVGFAGACHLLADAATNLRYAMAYLKRALDRGGAGCAGVSLYQRGVYGRASCSGYGRQVMARAAQ